MSYDLTELPTGDLLNLAASAEDQHAFAEAVGELVMRYKHVVYSQARYVCRNDPSLADDVFQNTFLRLFSWLQHRRGKPSLHSFPGLLKVFARRAAIDMLRKQHHATEPPESEMDPNMEAVLYARALVESLEGLQREVIELSFFEGLSAKEIAVRLGVSAGNVRVLRYRALEQIRERQTLDEIAAFVDPV